MENVFYYYLKKLDFDASAMPIHRKYGVVAFTYEDGLVNRGISYCSTADNFNKSFGRQKALGRLKRVLHLRQDIYSEPYSGKRSTAPEIKGDISGILTLGSYASRPTDLELKIAKVKGKRVEVCASIN